MLLKSQLVSSCYEMTLLSSWLILLTHLHVKIYKFCTVSNYRSKKACPGREVVTYGGSRAIDWGRKGQTGRSPQPGAGSSHQGLFRTHGGIYFSRLSQWLGGAQLVFCAGRVETLNFLWCVGQPHTLNKCPAIYTNNCPNESYLGHSFTFKGVFRLGEPTDRKLGGQVAWASSALTILFENLHCTFWRVSSAGLWAPCRPTPCWIHLCTLQDHHGAHDIVGTRYMVGNLILKGESILSWVEWAEWTLALPWERPKSAWPEETGVAGMKGPQRSRAAALKVSFPNRLHQNAYSQVPSGSLGRRLRHMHFKQALPIWEPQRNCVRWSVTGERFCWDKGNLGLAKALSHYYWGIFWVRNLYFVEVFKMSRFFHWSMEIKLEIRFLGIFFLTLK